MLALLALPAAPAVADGCGGTAPTAAGICCADADAPVVLTPTPEPASKLFVSPALPSVAVAQRIVVDPETGFIVAEPPAVDTPPRWMGRTLSQRVSTSHAGLVEEPGPAGSVKIDLRDRFMTMLVGRVGPDGEVGLGHVVPEPDPVPPASEAGEVAP